VSGVTSLKSEVAAFWAQRSRDHVTDRPATPQARAALLALLRDMLGPEARGDVLELGAGAGALTELLVELGGQVTGIDLHEPMLARARARLSGKALLLVGDAEHLTEPDDSQDAVVCHNLVWTLTDPARAFTEWARVLRPGGRLVILDGDWVNFALFGAWRQSLAALLDRRNGHAPRPADAALMADLLPRLPFGRGLRPGHLLPLLAMAGFGDFVGHDLKPVERARRRGLSGSARLLSLVHEGFAVSACKLG
jgi:SAM-dependent methyltransferase